MAYVDGNASSHPEIASCSTSSRRFHRDVLRLLMRLAPSAVGFTCVGAENVRAFSFTESTSVDAPTVSCWVPRLSDLLPSALLDEAMGAPCVVAAADLGSAITGANPDDRVLVSTLRCDGTTTGAIGLLRRRGEPDFSLGERKQIVAQLMLLGLASSYALAVDVLACERTVARAGLGRSELVMLADDDARRVFWAHAPGRALDWSEDIAPLERALFAADASTPLPERARRLRRVAATFDLAVGVERCSVISLPAASEPSLSRREREVADLLTRGYANLNIAAHLGISENTIRTYIRRLYRKLNVYSRVELMHAYGAGL